MAAKPKHTIPGKAMTDGSLAKRQLTRAHKAYAKGDMCVEDYIWNVMQCYVGQPNASTKRNGRFN
jgi:hypothetical protein